MNDTLNLSYTALQTLPNSKVKFAVIYHQGALYFQFVAKHIEGYLNQQGCSLTVEQEYPKQVHDVLKTIVELTVSNPMPFNTLLDAENWLATNYAVHDIQWNLRRVGDIHPTCVPQELTSSDASLLEYPTYDNQLIVIAMDEKNNQAALVGLQALRGLTQEKVDALTHTWIFFKLA